MGGPVSHGGYLVCSVQRLPDHPAEKPGGTLVTPDIVQITSRVKRQRPAVRRFRGVARVAA
jgi:hypothetical protein